MLAVVREFDLDSLTVRIGEATYEFVARTEGPAVVYAAPAAGARPGDALVPAAAPSAPVAAANVKKITAPVIGVFYLAPSPGAEPFVSVGDRIVAGQVLCILEAMKMMNEIMSDYAGVVKRILPENGALVSLGEEMFWIEP